MGIFTKTSSQKMNSMWALMMNVSKTLFSHRLNHTVDRLSDIGSKTCNLVLYLNYYLNTTQSQRRRRNADGVFEDISLNNKPQLQFSWKYDRNVEINSNLTVSSTTTQAKEDVSETGFLQYEATVKDVKIGRDSFTEVLITPKHQLSNIYAV